MLFVSLLSSPSWSITIGDLVERDDLYYEKFTGAPYTGEVTGKEQGSIENGKREGAWISYRENGQLRYEGKYKNGMKDGAWFSYYKGNKSAFVQNHKNGIVWEYIE